MNVRIVRRPTGEAPEEVRNAWVGLSLPLVPGYPATGEWQHVGVQSGPRSWLGVRLKGLLGGPRMRGYAVDTEGAVRILERVNPLAAAWWRVNTPHLFKPGLFLLFNEECGVIEESPI